MGAGRTPEAGVMMGAVTAVEGLLPVLPPPAILAQLVGPAERPGGGGTVPTPPVQLLLAPDVHRHATPQLLNRVAGLLLQASIASASHVRTMSHAITLIEAPVTVMV